MLRYTCANCQRQLEVDDSLAGQRVRCPHCGNVEIIPAVAAAVAAPVAPAAAAGGPVGPRPAAAGPAPGVTAEAEQELARVHPVVFRARPVKASGLVLLIVAGLALAGTAWVFKKIPPAYAPWAGYAGLVCAAVGVVWLLVWKIGTLSTTLVITNRRTMLNRGLFSRRSSEMRHEQVQDIQVVQTFAQRMMRVGSLGLDSSGTDEIELAADDLPDPMRLRELIDTHRVRG